MKNQNNSYQNALRYAAKTLAAFFIIASCTFSAAQAQDLDVPYVPTPQEVVDKMLDLADVQKGDYVIDLGSGDGRIVISAVKRGAYGHGIDLDPQRIKEARQNARDQNIEDQVMFVQGNIFETDFSEASVITMYLLNSVNQKLRPKLLDNLEPGTRVVSHSFSMGDWEADKEVNVSPESGMRSHTIYYWVIPAKVEGNWSWQMDGTDTEISVNQQYQEIDVRPASGSWNVSEAILHGKRISFKMTNGEATHLYSGRVEGDSISGMVQKYTGDDHTVSTWSATRN